MLYIYQTKASNKIFKCSQESKMLLSKENLSNFQNTSESKIDKKIIELIKSSKSINLLFDF